MQRILSNPGFRTHLIVYLAVNAGLLLINLLTAPKALWFYWPLLGWGLGILGHAFLVSQTSEKAGGSPVAAGSAAQQADAAITASDVEERARQLWQAHGTKAIAEAAEKARAAEAAGLAAHAQTWRRIESALIQLRGPRAS